MATDNLTNPSLFEIYMPQSPILASMVQSIDIGGTTLNETILPYSDLDINVPSEKLVYGRLDLTFIVDENMDAFVEVYNNMSAMVGPNSDEQSRRQLYQDVSVVVLDTSRSRKVRTFTFVNCWFTFLGNLSFDTSSNDPMISSVTLSFQSFRIDPNNIDTTGFYKTDYDAEKKINTTKF